MRYPALRYGADGPAVRALQNGLHRALAAKDLDHNNLRNGTYGSQTRKDVCRFKAGYGLDKSNCKIFGSNAWKELRPFLGKYDLGLIRQHKAMIEAKRKERDAAIAEATSEVAMRAKLAAVALRGYAERWRYTYAQTRPYSKAFFTGGRYYDCSSFITMCYYVAGLPDPNGMGFNGYGYTGTQWNRGSYTTSPKAGDLAFYGNMGNGIPSHVAIHISPYEVVSFGSNPVKRLPVRYRGDYRGSRSYV